MRVQAYQFKRARNRDCPADRRDLLPAGDFVMVFALDDQESGRAGAVARREHAEKTTTATRRRR